MTASPADPDRHFAPAAATTTFAVLDIDGVVADVSARVHHLAKSPKDWQAFFAAAPRDRPLPQGVALAQELARDHLLVYLTGRPTRLRRTTESWLQRHALPPGRLLMRNPGDYRPASITKVEMIRRLDDEHPVYVVVDDDPAVVRAVQEAGFAALLATWGPPGHALHAAQEGAGRT